jgi:ABC-type uncharacterized transport system involved in gliding motility auxiliary subunit
MPDPQKIAQSITEGTGPVTLAAQLTGKLTTNFPDGITVEVEDDESDEEPMPPEEEAEDAEADEETTRKLEAVQQAAEGAVVLVFSDVDMLTDMLSYQQHPLFGTAQVGDNASLVFNSLEFLGGSEDLINIRSRGQFRRPFEVVDRIEAEAEKATADKTAALEAKISTF